jgi:hypothetical protein
MPPVLSLDAKTYRNTGSYGSPTWTLINNIKDLTLPGEKADFDLSTRGNGGHRAYAGTLKDTQVDFNMVWDPADADMVAIRTAYTNNTTIEFLFLDGLVATNGSQGPRVSMIVTKFERTENLEEALMVNVTLKPAYSSNAPSWYVVGA